MWTTPHTNAIFCLPNLEGREAYLEELREDWEGRKGRRLTVLTRIPTIEEIRDIAEGKRLLMILDDVLGFKNEGAAITSLMTIFSHHDKISCLVSLQNPFLRPSKDLDLVTMGRNNTGILLMAQRNDYYVFSKLNTRLFPDCKNFLTHCMEESEQRLNTNYVFVNTAPHSPVPRRYMVYTCLFEEERRHGSPVFFDMEKWCKKI